MSNCCTMFSRVLVRLDGIPKCSAADAVLPPGILSSSSSSLCRVWVRARPESLPEMGWSLLLVPTSWLLTSWGMMKPKLKVLLSYHFSNLYDFLSYVEHKRLCLAECTRCSFPMKQSINDIKVANIFGLFLTQSYFMASQRLLLGSFVVFGALKHWYLFIFII